MNNQFRFALVLLLALHGGFTAQPIIPTPEVPPVVNDVFETPKLFASALGILEEHEETVSVLLPGAKATRLDTHFQIQPLSFERNEGQADAEAKFLARGPGYHLFLTDAEAVMMLSTAQSSGGAEFSRGAHAPCVSRPAPSPNASLTVEYSASASARSDRVDFPTVDPVGEAPAGASGTDALPDPTGTVALPTNAETIALPKPSVLRMRLVGANSSPSIRGEEELRGKVNYFIGNDPSRWRTNISTFAKVRYQEVYPGIDLVYYGNEGQLEYDFIVGPGADPNRIALAIEGADKLEVDERGDLIMHLGDQEVRWRKPQVYQDLAGTKQEIACSYQVDSTTLATLGSPSHWPGLSCDSPDGTREMFQAKNDVALPGNGDSAHEKGWGRPVPSSKETGRNASGDKLSPPLSSWISNPVGGSPTGAGESPALPRTQLVSFNVAAYDPTHALVIDPVLIYGTFLGGSNGPSTGYGIAVDRHGGAYVAGQTASAQFPTKNPLQGNLAGQTDVFITKLDVTGQIVYSTYVGGNGNDYDFKSCIAVDSAGSAYVVGETYSSNFPVVNPLQPNIKGGTQIAADAFVLKLNSDGAALVYSTYLGGTGNDGARGIAVDSASNAYIWGNTRSTDFPTTNAIQPQYGGGPTDAFVAKVNPAGTALVYSTYLGGSDFDFARAIAIDGEGTAHIGGDTKSRDFPTRSALQVGYAGGAWDAFLAKLGPRGDALLFASFFGGTSYDYIQAIGVGSDGDTYFAGLTGSTDLPTANAIQPQNNAFGGSGGILANTAFVARYNPASNSLVFSTYLGGSVSDEARVLALDVAGNVYVGGQTASPDFPITADPFQASHAGGGGTLGLGSDAFLSVLSSDGSNLIYSSFLGGSRNENINGVALDPGGNVYVTGDTGSADFPVQNPVLPNLVSAVVALVVKFSPIVDPPPLLQIRRSGNTVVITWPVAAGFQLESATGLSANNAWSTVTDPIVVVGAQNTFNVDSTSSRQFYRLRKQ